MGEFTHPHSRHHQSVDIDDDDKRREKTFCATTISYEKEKKKQIDFPSHNYALRAI